MTCVQASPRITPTHALDATHKTGCCLIMDKHAAALETPCMHCPLPQPSMHTRKVPVHLIRESRRLHA